MTRFLLGVATFAMMATAPATAQILGGGVGGGLGGGLGGTMGGVTGSVGSSIDTTRSAASAADRARDVSRQAERTARRAERQAERQAARDRKTGLAGAASADGAVAGRNGSLTGMAAADSIVSPRNRALSAQGSGNVARDSNLRTRGIMAASQRGLKRVDATATGVPVFVRSTVPARGGVVVVASAAPYPVYRQGTYYYGGPDVVFVDRYAAGGYMDRQYGDLRRDLEGTGATVRRRGETIVVDLPADVTFAFDRADIQPRFYGSLNAVARTLDNYPATDVEVVGHTDSVGSETYNLGLSERRGRSVADYLVNRDAEPSRLVVEAMGESEPVSTNATVQGRAANRRVEIVLHPRAA